MKIPIQLNYCQKQKGLKLYAYVFVLNHLHIIASSPDTIAFVRDFKKFTKIRYIHANPVRKQYVKNPEDWVWASANNESTIKVESAL